VLLPLNCCCLLYVRDFCVFLFEKEMVWAQELDLVHTYLVT
jgi:hypothetical protein